MTKKYVPSQGQSFKTVLMSALGQNCNRDDGLFVAWQYDEHSPRGPWLRSACLRTPIVFMGSFFCFSMYAEGGRLGNPGVGVQNRRN